VAYRPVARQRPETNETTAVAMEWRGKHISTIELLLEMVFYTRSVEMGNFGSDSDSDPVS
jgi:hypothetical protein